MFLNTLKQQQRDSNNSLLEKKPKSKEKPPVQQKKRKLKSGHLHRLEHMVLGNEDFVIESLKHKELGNKKVKDSSAKSVESGEEESDDEEPERKKPVWNDDDDDCEYDNKIYAVRQTSQFASETPKWAQLNCAKNIKKRNRKKRRFLDDGEDNDDDDDEDDDNDEDDEDDQVGLSRSTGDYLTSSSTLTSINLQIKKCSDLNKECASYDLSALEFHRKSTVALTAGSDFRFHLFQIDGEQNRKIHTVVLERFAVQCGHFSTEGNEIIFGSGHRYFCYFNLESAQLIKVPVIKNLEENKMSQFLMSPDGRFIVFLGSNGYLHLLSARSKEHLTSFKMNGTVSSVAFSPDGNRMYSFGSDSQVYVWDMDSRRCIHKFYDDGCVNGTSLAVSPNHKYLACGSDSGVVNVYNVDTCMDTRTPQPHKALMKLTTACTSLRFNHTSELLVTASNNSEKGIKLVHLPSFTVFRNFPDRMYKGIHFPIAIDISPNSGYLTVGTNNGRALLYRLKHYSSY